MSQIYQNLDKSRHYLVYKFIQNLKTPRHLFLDGGSTILVIVLLLASVLQHLQFV